jgi:hypothetical protein
MDDMLAAATALVVSSIPASSMQLMVEILQSLMTLSLTVDALR